MKQLFPALLLLLAQTASAEPYDYPYMAFQTADGIVKTVSVSSFSLTISNGVLIATSDDGTEQFSLSDLSKMYFTTEAVVTKVQNPETTDSSEVEVTSLAGIPCGTFPSVEAARQSLPAGMYIVKNSKETFKIAVK